jgi:hypothetical protein
VAAGVPHRRGGGLAALLRRHSRPCVRLCAGHFSSRALATSAVYAKKLVAHFAGAESWRAMMAGRLFEAAAALAVFAFGLALLMAALYGGGMRG